jgi:cupin fold WbuC family metalloprotein
VIANRKESNEVLYPTEDIVVVGAGDLSEMKRLAVLNPRKRIRLCTHRCLNDPLHEMFIVHTSDCYVRPHKHIDKVESMAILEGTVDVLLFDDNGDLRQIIKMGSIDSGRCFYYRLPGQIYHMLLIKSPFLVFHEVTEGPFQREKIVYPDWAPEENSKEQNAFIARIQMLIK